MKLGTAAALTLLLGCLAPRAEAQTSARVFVVMVDDLRFTPSETRNAERLLASLCDEILTAADLVGIVSTGPSGVATDLHSPADPGRLNDSIRRITTSVDGRWANQPPGARIPPATRTSRSRQRWTWSGTSPSWRDGPSTSCS
jgi:hypothetical protein